MKKYYKLFYAFFAVMLVIFLLLGPAFFQAEESSIAKAVSLEKLQVLITDIQNRLSNLENQINRENEEPLLRCHDFNVNLRYGMRGSEVRSLQTALKKEGFYNRSVTGYFDEYTASAVVGFQEKYASDILASWGLTHGTGYVGSTTITKLNDLYKCEEEEPKEEDCHTSDLWSWKYCTSDCKCNAGEGDCDSNDDCTTGYCAYNVGKDYGQNSKMDVCQEKEEEEKTIEVISPNGGEEWERGSVQKIIWNYEPLPPDEFKISLVNVNNDTIVTDLKNCGTAGLYQDSSQPTKFWWNWEVGENAEGKTIPAVGSYRIMVTDCEETKDFSDTSFTMVNPVQKSITVVSPNGGEEWEKGKTYVVDWESIGADDIEVISLIDYSDFSNPTGYHLAYHHSTELLYSWTISDSFEVGSKYKIEVVASSGDTIFSDESDGYFSIVGSFDCNDADISSSASGVSDGTVNVYDLLKVRQCVGEDVSGDCEIADINNDGVINEDDADIIREFYLQECIVK